MNKIWNTTVSKVLSIFRGALMALLPWLEKARIPWRDGESYDDWDNIAEALFNNIVCSSLTGEVSPEYPLARYGYPYPAYSGMDFIQVVSEKYKDQILAFVSWSTLELPLDAVRVAVLDKDYKVTSNDSLSLENLTFLYVKWQHGKVQIQNELQVVL